MIENWQLKQKKKRTETQKGYHLILTYPTNQLLYLCVLRFLFYNCVFFLLLQRDLGLFTNADLKAQTFTDILTLVAMVTQLCS